MGKTFYDLSCEELCDLMCGKPEEDFEVENMGRGSSKAGGGSSAASKEFSNYPADFNIKGLKELKEFEGTRGELYNLVAKLNPTAIVDKRTADVFIGDSPERRENDHYIMIMKKTPNKKMKLNVMWKIGKGGGQYHIQTNEYRKNPTW